MKQFKGLKLYAWKGLLNRTKNICFKKSLGKYTFLNHFENTHFKMILKTHKSTFENESYKNNFENKF